MDINKVQRLNDMAINLKKHNIVGSPEDAVKHAERIYGREHNFTSDYANRPDESEDLKKDVRKLTFALRDAIMDIKELKVQVGKLQKELNDVRVNPPRIIQRQVVMQQPEFTEKKEEPAPMINEEPEPQTRLVEEQPKKDINHPIDRNNISPSEVSIEKFFNFSNK